MKACLIFACLLVLAPFHAYCEDGLQVAVSASLPQGDAPYIRGAPMKVVFYIDNKSSGQISILGSDFSANVTCVCSMKNGKPLKNIPKDLIGEKQSTFVIPAAKKTSRAIFLNNYFEFAEEGEFQVTWTLNMPIIHEGGVESLEVSGVINTSVVNEPENKITAELDRYMVFFRASEDPIIKRLTIDAVASVRSPLALSYLEQCLFSGGFDTLVMLRLGNRWGDDKWGQKIIDRYLLQGRDVSAISLAIKFYVLAGRILSDDAMQRFLTSDDPSLYDCGIQYLLGTLQRLRLDLLDENSVKDEQRKQLSKPVLEYLHGVLTRNPGAQGNNASGNGF